MKIKSMTCLIPLLFASFSVAQDNFCDFSDEFSGYRLQYPCHWKAQTHSESSGMIRADFSGESLGFQVRSYKKNRRLEDFFQWYLDQFIKDMESRWGGKAEIKDRSSLNRYLQAVIVLKRSDGQVWEFWEYVFEGNQQFIAFQCGVREEENASGAVFNQIADSFRFIN